MRRAFLVGLGIGAAMGTLWVVTAIALVGKTYFYQHWYNVPAWFAMLLLIAAVAGGVWGFTKFED